MLCKAPILGDAGRDDCSGVLMGDRADGLEVRWFFSDAIKLGSNPGFEGAAVVDLLVGFDRRCECAFPLSLLGTTETPGSDGDAVELVVAAGELPGPTSCCWSVDDFGKSFEDEPPALVFAPAPNLSPVAAGEATPLLGGPAISMFR